MTRRAFPFLWVPNVPDPVQLVGCSIVPEVIQFALSVQPHWQGSKGLLRGHRAPDRSLMEDFIDEEIDEHGVLRDAGRRIFGAAAMRRQVWTVEEHVAEYRRKHPRHTIYGVAGDGNLLSNPHFVGCVGVEQMLYHLAGERQFLQGRAGRPYTCLLVRKPEFRPRVSIETLYFSTADGYRVLSQEGVDITDQVEYATFGQEIVADGRPIDLESLIRDVRDGKWYDLRHVSLFGRIPRGGGVEQRWIDAGLAAFWKDGGVLDVDAVAAALRDDVLRVNIDQFRREDVVTAMAEKGYCQVADPRHAGEYALVATELRVVLRLGIYPHSMVGVRDDGSVLWVGIGGLSNRAGVTIFGAAEIMRSLGAVRALVIDNGGDVRLDLAGRTWLGSAEGQRNRFRSVLVFRSDRQPAPVLGDGLELFSEVRFPRS